MVKQGTIIEVNFNPQLGHEQAGYRPAVVVSNEVFNEKTKLVLVCPITSNVKSFPLHVILDSSTRTKGAILCEHVRALDIYSRGFKVIEQLPKDVLEQVLDIIHSELEIL